MEGIKEENCFSGVNVKPIYRGWGEGRGGGYCLKEWTVFLRGVHTPMYTMGKARGWWILMGDLSNRGGG